MKKLLSLLLAGTISAIVVYPVQAQTDGALLPIRHAGSDPAAVKATSQFWKTFGESTDEKWYPAPNGFLAEFSEKNVQVRVVYNKKGDWIYTIRQYTEKELPEDVRAQVKSRFYDDAIGVVKEVIQAQSTVYLIHIENGTRWKTIRVSEGELDVVQDFKIK